MNTGNAFIIFYLDFVQVVFYLRDATSLASSSTTIIANYNASDSYNHLPRNCPGGNYWSAGGADRKHTGDGTNNERAACSCCDGSGQGDRQKDYDAIRRDLSPEGYHRRGADDFRLLHRHGDAGTGGNHYCRGDQPGGFYSQRNHPAILRHHGHRQTGAATRPRSPSGK